MLDLSLIHISFLFFRLRLLICIMLFLAFVTADKYVLTKEDTAPVFQKIEKNQSYNCLLYTSRCV